MSADMYLGPEFPDLPDEPDAPDLPDGTPVYRITNVLPRQAAPYGPAGEYPHPAAPAAAPADHEAPQPHPADRDDDQDTGEHHHPDTTELEVCENDEGEAPDEDAEEDDGQEEEHEPAPRALTIPDLRPYADVTAAVHLVREYGPTGARAAVRLTRQYVPVGAHHIAKRFTIARRVLRTATAHVAKVLRPVWLPLCTWCADAPGPRIGGGAVAVFLAGHPIHAPGAVRVAAAVGWVMAVSATLALNRGEGEGKPKKKTRGKKEEAPVEVSKEAGPPPAPAVPPAPAGAPAVDMSAFFPEPDDDPEDTPDETPVEPPEPAPVAPPPPPSREALAEALHHLYAGGSGVLLTTLRDHLSMPDTRALKTLLDGAGIRWREGVRCPAGNAAGIHHRDFPALTLSQEDPQGNPLTCDNTANNNNNNAGEGSREGVRVVHNDFGLTVFDPHQSGRTDLSK